MKKFLPIILLLCLLPLKMSAQDVYNYLLDATTNTVNNPTSSYTQVRIAQFKRTALVYLKRKAFETMPEVTEQFLNKQAYYMSEYVALFFDELLKGKKDDDNKRKAKIYLFMDTSKANPLFNDPDTDITDAYIIEGNELTPFSLNTDWQKAYGAVKVELEKQK